MHICGYTRAYLHWRFLEGCSTRGSVFVHESKRRPIFPGAQASLHPVESAINPDTRLVATNPLYLRYIRRRGGRRGGWYYNADLCLERDRSRSSTSWIKEYLEMLWRQSWLEDSGSKQSRVWKVMEDKIRGGEGGMGGRGWWVYSHDSALRSLRTCLLNFYHEHLHFYRPPRRRS